MRRRRMVIGSVGIATCVWCGWASGYHRTTAAAEITWLVTAITVIVADTALWRGRTGGRLGGHLDAVGDPWPRPGRGGNRSAFWGVAPWLALVGVVVAWEVLGIDTGPHRYHLTISALAQAYRPLNAALLLVWVLVGIGYEAARVRSPASNLAMFDGPRDPGASGNGNALAATMASMGNHHGAPALLLPSSPPVGVAFWVAVPLVAVLIDIAARHSKGRRATAEEFVRFVSTTRLAHITLVAAWFFAGYHLFAR